jgi:hypothetical protein
VSPTRKLRRRPSTGAVLGFVALFAALAGAATALPGKNTVDSGDIKRRAVRTSDIAPRAVTAGKIPDGGVTNAKLAADAVDSGKVADGSIASGDIANGSLTGADVSPNSLGGADINESTLGATLDVVYARNQTCTVAEATQGSCTATCPDGRNVLGGGVVAEGNHGEQVEVNGSRPNPNNAAATGWTGFVDNNADLGGANNNNSVTVYAICAPIASGSFLAVTG